jgi:CRISPR/Cas system-associated exonuclease Cas4 (RecB family)
VKFANWFKKQMRRPVIDLNEMLVKSLNAFDASRSRSQQVEVGPSSIGGCRRQVWHELKQTPETNPNTESLAAILGTFIHSGIEKSIRREDPFGDNFIIEGEFKAGDLKGHVDLFIKDIGLVVDWKTTKVKSLRYFPSKQQRWQVQIYGWLLEQNGHKVNEVALVAIPRDGEMADIRVHKEKYDAPTAEAGIAWLEEIKSLIASDAPAPAPEESLFFCTKYCSYYDQTGEVGCPSMKR